MWIKVVSCGSAVLPSAHIIQYTAPSPRSPPPPGGPAVEFGRMYRMLYLLVDEETSNAEEGILCCSFAPT